MSRFGETAFGAFIMAVAIGLFVISGEVRDFTNSAINAAFMPRIAATLLLILGAVTLFSGWRITATKARSMAESNTPKTSGIPFVLASMTLMLGYVMFLDTLGFVICSVSYVLGQILLLRKQAKKQWLTFLSVALLVPVLAYVLFVYLFEVMVPAGLLG